MGKVLRRNSRLKTHFGKVLRRNSRLKARFCDKPLAYGEPPQPFHLTQKVEGASRS